MTLDTFTNASSPRSNRRSGSFDFYAAGSSSLKGNSYKNSSTHGASIHGNSINNSLNNSSFLQNRPRLNKRQTLTGSYFNHEGVIQLSGESMDSVHSKNSTSNSHNHILNSNSTKSRGFTKSYTYGNSAVDYQHRKRNIATNNTINTQSSGLLYSMKAKKDLSSIDTVHDPNVNALICAGKSHLGYYTFSDTDNKLKCSFDLLYNTNNNTQLRRTTKQVKFNTIADVKTGFQNRSNTAAICTSSTQISLFDISRKQAYNSALVTSLAEHTRSVNSFDFNMVQTNLILSGGQDGFLKVWDIRSDSSNKRSKGCDISINTSYDSIRDCKWMPSYSFGSVNNTDHGRSNPGYKFASIHDSGILLKFDLRQPNSPEKKINAHTGPGLCLNWHPHNDYIVTGGRDGKCCLWNFGDKVSSNNNSSQTPLNMNSNSSSNNNYTITNLNNNSNSNLTVAFPETTINIGSPITKLKFRPHYDNNIYNSLVAISSMGEDAQVSIYSLARKYIPKHQMKTEAFSVGLAWHNQDTIFNIDKDNYINGWDITQEPRVLDNLCKITTLWRDIDGYGFTFVDQDGGSYEVEDNKHNSNTNSHNNSSHYNATKGNSNATKNANNLNNPNTSLIGTPNILNSAQNLPNANIKNTMSYSNLPHETLLSSKANMLSTKSLPSKVSLNSKSNVSLNSLTSQLGETNAIKAPYIVTLDLPYIFNGMKLRSLQKMRKDYNNLLSSNYIFKETPVETFKYLVRELEFSVEHDTRNSENNLFSKKSTSSENENLSSNITNNNDDEYDQNKENANLMKKFGFSENATWAALISKTRNDNNSKGATDTKSLSTVSEYEQDDISRQSKNMYTNFENDYPKLSKENTTLNGLTGTPGTNNNNNNNNSNNNNNKLNSVNSNNTTQVTSKSTNSLVDKEVSNLSKALHDTESEKFTKAKLLIELTSVANHNASVYSNIGDLHHFKIWILIRDSILWDLKNMNLLNDNEFNEDRDNEKNEAEEDEDYLYAGSVHSSDLIVMDNDRRPTFSASSAFSDRSVNTDFGSSLVEERPRALKEPATVTRPISSLQRQLKKSINNESNEASIPKLTEINDVTVSPNTKLFSEIISENEDVFEDDDVHNGMANLKNIGSPVKGIPIVRRRRSERLSFIDTYMSERRSLGGYMDQQLQQNPFHVLRSKHSSLTGTPNSNVNEFNNKRNNNNEPQSFFEKMINKMGSGSAFDKNGGSDLLNKENAINNENVNNIADSKKTNNSANIMAPWNTKRLVKQIYIQSVESGDFLLAVNILLLFHTIYDLTTPEIAKNSVSEFLSILHRFETFDIAAALLKYCSWDDIMHNEMGQSQISIFCENCHELIINEKSKEFYTIEQRDKEKNGDSNISSLQRFGYWYCDSCKRSNTLCVICEKPMKKMVMGLLSCGHEGHFDCLQDWFIEEDMDVCPCGCAIQLNF